MNKIDNSGNNRSGSLPNSKIQDVLESVMSGKPHIIR